jgi:hypothetical protein
MSETNRPYFLALVMLLSSLSALAQAGGTAAKTDNLYSKALFASMAEMEKEWSGINDGYDTNYHHMLVAQKPEITEGLPSEFGDYHVEYLDTQAQVGRYKKLGKEFAILEIHPIQSDGAELKINISVSYVSYKKGRLMLAVSDWSDVELRYDCEKRNYVVSSVKLGGI